MSPKRLAVFPGTFDPITNGHANVIRRAAALVDEIVVAVGDNPDKPAMLPRDVRARIVGEVVADLANVRVASYDGLTMDFARRLGAWAIVRGVRSAGDLAGEFQLAAANRAVGGIETLFIPTGGEHAFISSSLVRQIAAAGGDIVALVPPQVLAHLPPRRDATGDPPPAP